MQFRNTSQTNISIDINQAEACTAMDLSYQAKEFEA
jgi:hypothetical protein